jgi:hypothetical protein
MGLTVVGAVLLACGVMLVFVGSTLRLKSPHDGRGFVHAGEAVAICGLAFGVALLVVLAIDLADRAGRGGPGRARRGSGHRPASGGLIPLPSPGTGPAELRQEPVVELRLASRYPGPDHADNRWQLDADNGSYPDAGNGSYPEAGGSWSPGPAYVWSPGDDWGSGGEDGLSPAQADDWARDGQGGWGPAGQGDWVHGGQQEWAPDGQGGWVRAGQGGWGPAGQGDWVHGGQQEWAPAGQVDSSHGGRQQWAPTGQGGWATGGDHDWDLAEPAASRADPTAPGESAPTPDPSARKPESVDGPQLTDVSGPRPTGVAGREPTGVAGREPMQDAPRATPSEPEPDVALTNSPESNDAGAFDDTEPIPVIRDVSPPAPKTAEDQPGPAREPGRNQSVPLSVSEAAPKRSVFEPAHKKSVWEPGPQKASERDRSSDRDSHPDVADRRAKADPLPADTQAKLEQIKDLYLTAEAIGEDAFVKHFDQLSQRQRSLIREFFEQAGLGSSRTSALLGGDSADDGASLPSGDSTQDGASLPG